MLKILVGLENLPSKKEASLYLLLKFHKLLLLLFIYLFILKTAESGF